MIPGGALFGGNLWGEKAVRFIYVDEAGTSTGEPVTIVAAVIVNADEQLQLAEKLVSEILGAVPTAFQADFVFHATEIWGSDRYRDGWGLPGRLGLMKRMMAVPRRINLPISFAMVRRSATTPPSIAGKLSPEKFQHVVAFGLCAAMADLYLRDHADSQEVATIIAEDVPEIRKLLKASVDGFRQTPVTLPPGLVIPTGEELALGYVTQESEYRVSRIRKAVHFVEKRDDPMTQVVDAVAFGLRRYFAEQSFGDQFAEAICGRPPPLSDFAGPMSTFTFRWKTA